MIVFLDLLAVPFIGVQEVFELIQSAPVVVISRKYIRSIHLPSGGHKDVAESKSENGSNPLVCHQILKILRIIRSARLINVSRPGRANG